MKKQKDKFKEIYWTTISIIGIVFILSLFIYQYNKSQTNEQLVIIACNPDNTKCLVNGNLYGYGLTAVNICDKNCLSQTIAQAKCDLTTTQIFDKDFAGVYPKIGTMEVKYYHELNCYKI
jgi:hypothetical protein